MFPSFVCQPHAFSFCRASVIQTAACKWRGAAARLLFPEKNCIPDSYFGTRRCANVRAQKSEEENALSAAGFADTGAPTIFDKIIKKEIPSTVVYEDDKVLAFRDINPQAPIHIILIPKVPDGLTQLSKADERHKDILGHLMYTTGVIAKQEGIAEGYRVVINNGPTAYPDSARRESICKGKLLVRSSRKQANEAVRLIEASTDAVEDDLHQALVSVMAEREYNEERNVLTDEDLVFSTESSSASDDVF